MKQNQDKGKYPEMTNEEYRAELQQIFSRVDNNKLLHDFYTYAKRQQERVDYYVSEPDYGDMIIEMVGEIKNEGTLEYLYTFLQLFIEKWG